MRNKRASKDGQLRGKESKYAKAVASTPESAIEKESLVLTACMNRYMRRLRYMGNTQGIISDDASLLPLATRWIVRSLF
ncbi:MAG: hypothetical protein JW732_09145 [Dehalococcoidia bacterium]|nr:hypothetical protein [Dehalococcoidia bacterium]